MTDPVNNQWSYYRDRHNAEIDRVLNRWMIHGVDLPATLFTTVAGDSSWATRLQNLVLHTGETTGVLESINTEQLRLRVGRRVIEVPAEHTRIRIAHPATIPAGIHRAEEHLPQHLPQLARRYHLPPTQPEKLSAGLKRVAGVQLASGGRLLEVAAAGGFSGTLSEVSCSLVDSGQPVTCRLSVAGHTPERPVTLGELSFEVAGVPAPAGEVGAVAWSEAHRMAELLAAGEVPQVGFPQQVPVTGETENVVALPARTPEGILVTVTGQSQTPVVAAALTALGGVVGEAIPLELETSRQAPGFPHWPLAQNPGAAEAILNAAAELDRARALAATSPKLTGHRMQRVAAELSGPAPEALPGFHEELGRIYRDLGHRGHARAQWGTARRAEAAFALAVDDQRHLAAVREFSEQGLFSAADLVAEIRGSLAHYDRPQAAYRYCRALTRTVVKDLDVVPVDVLYALRHVAGIGGIDPSPVDERFTEFLLELPDFAPRITPLLHELAKPLKFQLRRNPGAALAVLGHWPERADDRWLQALHRLDVFHHLLADQQAARTWLWTFLRRRGESRLSELTRRVLADFAPVLSGWEIPVIPATSRSPDPRLFDLDLLSVLTTAGVRWVEGPEYHAPPVERRWRVPGEGITAVFDNPVLLRHLVAPAARQPSRDGGASPWSRFLLRWAIQAQADRIGQTPNLANYREVDLIRAGGITPSQAWATAPVEYRTLVELNAPAVLARALREGLVAELFAADSGESEPPPLDQQLIEDAGRYWRLVDHREFIEVDEQGQPVPGGERSNLTPSMAQLVAGSRYAGHFAAGRRQRLVSGTWCLPAPSGGYAASVAFVLRDEQGRAQVHLVSEHYSGPAGTDAAVITVVPRPGGGVFQFARNETRVLGAPELADTRVPDVGGKHFTPAVGLRAVPRNARASRRLRAATPELAQQLLAALAAEDFQEHPDQCHSLQSGSRARQTVAELFHLDLDDPRDLPLATALIEVALDVGCLGLERRKALQRFNDFAATRDLAAAERVAARHHRAFLAGQGDGVSGTPSLLHDRIASFSRMIPAGPEGIPLQDDWLGLAELLTTGKEPDLGKPRSAWAANAARLYAPFSRDPVRATTFITQPGQDMAQAKAAVATLGGLVDTGLLDRPLLLLDRGLTEAMLRQLQDPPGDRLQTIDPAGEIHLIEGGLGAVPTGHAVVLFAKSPDHYLLLVPLAVHEDSHVMLPETLLGAATGELLDAELRRSLPVTWPTRAELEHLVLKLREHLDDRGSSTHAARVKPPNPDLVRRFAELTGLGRELPALALHRTPWFTQSEVTDTWFADTSPVAERRSAQRAWRQLSMGARMNLVAALQRGELDAAVAAVEESLGVADLVLPPEAAAELARQVPQGTPDDLAQLLGAVPLLPLQAARTPDSARFIAGQIGKIHHRLRESRTDPAALELLESGKLTGLLAALRAGRTTAGQCRAAGAETAEAPQVVAPELVAEVAAATGVSPDAAAYYLQVATIFAPDDARIRRANGWEAGRLRRAATELVDAGLLVRGRRTGAGREVFLPGAWLPQSKRGLPVEEWKKGHLPMADVWESSPLLPGGPSLLPMDEQFHRVWQRLAPVVQRQRVTQAAWE